MGCVSDKPKAPEPKKVQPQVVPSSQVKQDVNVSADAGKPQSNVTSGNKVQGQPENPSMVKVDDPLKTKQIESSGIRENNNNPYTSDPASQKNAAVGAPGTNVSGMGRAGEAKGYYQPEIQQNGNSSGIKGSNPQASGGNFESMMRKEDKFGGMPMESGMQGNSRINNNEPNPYLGPSGVHSSNQYASAGQSEGPPRSAIKVNVVPPGEHNKDSKPSSVIKPAESVMVGSNVQQDSSGKFTFGNEGGSKHAQNKEEINTYAYGTGVHESKNETLMRLMVEGKQDVPEEQRVPAEGKVETEGYLWNSGLLKLD